MFWLQHEAKKSRVLRRVLSSSLHDPVLAGLHAERQSDMQAASDALKNVVIAHKTLRASLQSGLGRDSWGVIQRAFNLVQQPVGGCGEHTVGASRHSCHRWGHYNWMLFASSERIMSDVGETDGRLGVVCTCCCQSRQAHMSNA